MGMRRKWLHILFYSFIPFVPGTLSLPLLNVIFLIKGAFTASENLHVPATLQEPTSRVDFLSTFTERLPARKVLVSRSNSLPVPKSTGDNETAVKFPDIDHCPVNYYQCPNTSHCILIAHLCDGIVHCPQADDEGEHCASSSCLSSTCQYGCRPSLKGPLCFCPEGTAYNGTHCTVLSAPSQFLLYTVVTPPSIRGAAISLPSFSSVDVIPPVYISGEAVALAHDPERNEIYFCEKKSYSEAIYKQNITTSHREVIIDKGLSSCSGLAADVAGYNLYWTDLEKGTISVVSLHNASVYRVLIKNETSQPRDIVLHLNKGYMYWIDQAFPSVQRAFLDGRHHTALFASDLHTPQLLTLHTCLDLLFWWDRRLNRLESANTDGSNRKVILKHETPSHLSGLVVFKGYTLWTDADHLGVVELKSASVKRLRVVSGTRLLQVFSSVNTQEECSSEINSACYKESNQCTDLCLTLPPTEHLPYTCACQEGYYLDNHSNKCVASSVQQCNEEEYHCQDGTCIPLSFVCDGQQDCPEENEEETCGNFTCPDERFSCGNGRCIPTDWVCDGHIDCTNALDESDCDAVNHCPYPSHLCDNGTICLDKGKVCDNSKDCIDGSDEQCEMLKPLPCEQWGYCSQLCHAIGNLSAVCDCSTGFRLLEDKHTCVSKDSTPPALLYTTGTDIGLFFIENDTEIILLKELHHTVHISFYFHKDQLRLIWSDVGSDNIYSAVVNGSALTNISVIASANLELVEGLAVDWSGGHLYWVESHHKHIEVAKLDGSFRTSLISGIHHPRGIAVDPSFGLLFWADWDEKNPRIERSDMGGRNRKIIVNIHNVDIGGWPNGVTLDYANKRLYWIDGKSGSIHSVDYEGNNHHEVYKLPQRFAKPFSVDVHENYVYWTDQTVIGKANRWTGLEKTVLIVAYPHLYDVKVLHSSRQPSVGKTPCSKDNGHCSHLCLLGFNMTAVCACPYGMKLNEDNRTCAAYDALIAYVTSEKRRILFTSAVEDLHGYLFPPVDIDNSVLISSLTIDVVENYIYWIEREEIKRQSLKEGIAKSVIHLGFMQPKALTLDSLSGNLYVMLQMHDGMNHQAMASRISVCTTQGHYFTDIIWDNIYEPLSLAVDSVNRYLFWIHLKKEQNDSNLWILEVSQLDGTDRKILLTSTESAYLQHPKGLVILSGAQKICWLNAVSHQIICVSYNGSFVFSAKVNNSSSSVIGGSENKLLYTEADSVHSVDLSTSSSHQLHIIKPGTVNFLTEMQSSTLSRKGLCFRNGMSCPAICVELTESNRKCLDFSGVKKFVTFLHAGTPIATPLPLSDTTNGSIPSVFPFIPFTTQHEDSFDFHVASQTIYWSDSGHGAVFSVRRDGVYQQHVLSTKAAITDLAVDWIAGNLYWSTLPDASISVSRLSGEHQFVVVHGNLKHPTSVAVDPVHGHLFWGESSNQARIERSTLSGRQRKVIVELNLNAVGDLAIDFDQKKLYWTDPVQGRIERADWNGEAREIVVAQSSYIDRPIAVSVSTDFVYWTDSLYLEGACIQAEKNNASNFKVLNERLGAVGKVKVFDEVIQSGSNPCAVANGGCEHLCFYEGEGKHTCTCVYSKLKPDGRSCTAHSSFLLLAHGAEIESYVLEDPVNPNPPLPTIHSLPPNSYIVALAFDQQQRRIFFSDLTLSPYLFSIDIATNNITPLLEGNEVKRIDGLSYDSTHSDLYWTDSANPSVCRLKVDTRGQMRRLPAKMERVLVLDSQDKPRGIVVDECNLFIFWTNWNVENPRIERCYLSGAQQQPIVTKGLSRPNGLALDRSTWTLFWADSRSDGTYAIGRCNIDGSDRKIVTEGTEHHPFSLGVHGSSVYWSDWKTGALLLTDKHTGKGPAIIRTGLENPMGLIIESGYSVVCPAASLGGTIPNGDPHQYRNCSGFCLNGATCTILQGKGRTCLCAENFTGIHCQTPVSTPSVFSSPTDVIGVFSSYSLLIGLILSLLPGISVLAIIFLVIYKRRCICRSEWCPTFKLYQKNRCPSPLSSDCRDAISSQTQESTLWASSCEEELTNPLFSRRYFKWVPSHNDRDHETIDFADRVALLKYGVNWSSDPRVNTML